MRLSLGEKEPVEEKPLRIEWLPQVYVEKAEKAAFGPHSKQS